MGAAVPKRPRDRASKMAAVVPTAHAAAPPFGRVAHFERGPSPSGGGPGGILGGRSSTGGGPEDDDMLVIDGSVAGEEEDAVLEMDSETGQLVPGRMRAVVSSPQSEAGEISGQYSSPPRSPPRSRSQSPAGGSGTASWGLTGQRTKPGTVKVSSALLPGAR